MTGLPRDMDYEERIREFEIGYDYANDPGATLVELVRAAGDFLSQIVGAENADVGMKLLIGTLAEGEDDWREGLKTNVQGAFSEWPLGQMLHNLSAYAHYGIDIEAREHEDQSVIETRLEGMVDTADRFLAICPLEAWLGRDRERQLEETILLARGRWALDHDRPIEPEALALFGGVKMSRMRNMLSGQNSTLRRENGLVPAKSAMDWLEKRPSFCPSIWRTARPNYDGEITTYTYAQPLFVPMARDGSFFHHGLERRGTFTIGEKGSERHVHGFRDALRDLQEMSDPAWRRPPPGDRGGWSIVRGTGWVRMSQQELDAHVRSEKELMKHIKEGHEDD
ncbi:MAG: hypothetical protein ABJH07_09825 [Sedimentitalea sp.]|uniref:hypothetical protein n=1 Tax=Sedimentitalea sp. TaxID=2048915 RepID=UPI0032640010